MSPEKEIPHSTSGDPSPSKRESRGLNQRSSSLDGTTSSSPEPVSSNKSSDASSLISRLTKTFEDKINEIRNEKQKDLKQMQSKESVDQLLDCSVSSSAEVEKVASSMSRPFESMKRFSLENRENLDSNNSPSKTKTTLVQDITEQTNKFKSDFNKNIRSKISELQNRKLPKDSTSSPKIRSAILHSLLKRDEGILTEDLLHECHAVDTAIEAHEDVQESQGTKKCSSKKASSQELTSTKILDSNEKLSDYNKEVTREDLPTSNNVLNLRPFLISIINEIFSQRKPQTMKFCSILFVVCFVLPLPRFLAGLVFGIVLASVIFFSLLHLILPKPEETFHYEPLQFETVSIPKHEENQLYIVSTKLKFICNLKQS